MSAYELPTLPEALPAEEGVVWTVASGDLRPAANRTCWPVQVTLEANLTQAVESLGWTVRRGHPIDEEKGHGFIDSQRAGIEIFQSIPKATPLIVAEAVWQYSHHVLAGLRDHRGPILLVANWAGDFPGLVGLLGLAGSLTKADVDYSVLWSEDFTDEWAIDGLRTWLQYGVLEHDQSHVHDLPELPDNDEVRLGRALAEQLQVEKAIAGVFDEGCMGMYNAIFDDELINPLGIYKERLSQSALVAEMDRVREDDAQAVHQWLLERGMTFRLGTDEATELTMTQLVQQYKMYIAVLRIADDFGLDAVGIQYQQGLKDTVAASDLAEGLLNDEHRPPVRSRDGSRELYAGLALPHFNEVDWGVAVDIIATNRIWKAMGLDPATTLHDIRWGEAYGDDFVWVFEISGAVPAAHHGGYAKSWANRQPPMYFPLGGGTLSGVSRPGELVWSRVFIMGGALHADVGRGRAVELPQEETRRRLDATTPEWPIMHAVLDGVGRNQLMSRHRSNHVTVVYAPDGPAADRALEAKVAMFDALGIEVHLVGDVSLVF